ncbi:MAG: hypothetical protein MUC78_03295 [Bacteroidales bacterium]|jgi:hypothetical protein|nr:hypothetical protein [Bacteroidales bacterium]
MKLLKQYWLVILIFVLVVLFVLLRTFSRNDFRYDAARWAEPSVLGSNIVTEEMIMNLTGEILLISLDIEAEVVEQLEEGTLIINPASILEKGNLSLIRKNKGPVILSSDDSSVSARVWMVLSQMGMDNVYILQNAEAGISQK